MKHLTYIASLFIFNLFTLCSLSAEAIDPENIGYFQLSLASKSVTSVAPPKPAAISQLPTTAPTTPAALLLKMPSKLMESNVVPASAPQLTAAGKKPPAGILPLSIDPKTDKPVLLMGYEQGNVIGFTDFGGSGDTSDQSRHHTAVREFNEETCLAFWEDLSTQKIDRNKMSGFQLESAAKQSLTQNVFPWYYTPRNKYFTGLLPVRYQSISDITKKMQIVRNKVSALPFFEKTDFAWIPLEDFIGWIKTGTQNPSIPGGKGRPISWRFFGLSLDDFTQNTPQWVRDRTIKYLEDIIALNK